MTSRLIVIGALGRMGQAICRLALESGEFGIAAAVEAAGHPLIGQTLQSASGLPLPNCHIRDSLADLEGGADVIIDFTFPQSTLHHLAAARKSAIPYVIGTTGFDAQETARIREAGFDLPVLLSPNMALGVNVMFQAAAFLARLMPDGFDMEIIEAHHNQKKDAPSGTARKLLEILQDTLKRPPSSACYGRSGMTGTRPRDEIGVHAVRGGDIVGEHRLLFAGTGEELELVHRARSRDVFAAGALRAARFLMQKPKGFYTMASVLGLD